MGRIWMSQMGSTIADMGRQYFDRLGSNTMKEDTRRLCHDLLSGQGVASDTALAREIVTLFREMERPDRGVNGQLPLRPRSNRCNHEAYVSGGNIACAPKVRALL